MKKLLVIAVASVLASCGYFEDDHEEHPPPEVVVIIDDPDNPDGGGGDPGQATPYTRMQQIINLKCISCHRGDDFTLSEGQLRDSRAFDMVRGGRMPPNAPLQGEERTDFLNFF